MLSRYTLKRLSIVFTIMIFFRVLPFDWNRAALRLSYTRSRLKNELNALIVYGLSLIVILLIYQYADDLLGRRLSAQGIILNFIIVLGAALALFTGLIIRLWPEEVSWLITQTFLVDKYCQERLLDPRTVEALASRSGLAIKVLNVLEPLSILHSFGVGMLFYQDYDVFRRYVYRHVQQALGLHAWEYEIGALFVYMGGVRLFYSYFLVLGMVIGIYSDTLSFWIGQLNKYEDLASEATATTLKRSCVIYRRLHILSRYYFESKFVRIVIPSEFLGLFAFTVFANVVTIKYYNTLNYGTLFVVATAPILILSTVHVFFQRLGMLLRLSEEFRRVWMPVARRGRLKRLERVLNSCPKLYVSMGGFFHVNLSAFLEFQSHVIDKTISLLLSVRQI